MPRLTLMDQAAKRIKRAPVLNLEEMTNNEIRLKDRSFIANIISLKILPKVKKLLNEAVWSALSFGEVADAIEMSRRIVIRNIQKIYC